MEKRGQTREEMENYGIKDHAGDSSHALLSELTRAFGLN